MHWELFEYTTASGRKPVREFISSLDKEIQTEIFALFKDFREHGFHLETNLLRKVAAKSNMWELRLANQGNQYRFLIHKIDDKQVVLLHVFIKKTQTCTKAEI